MPPTNHSYAALQLQYSTSSHLLTWHFALSQIAIRDFLRKRTSYDVLPLSFRLIVLDTDLLIKKSLNILIQNCKPMHKLGRVSRYADKRVSSSHCVCPSMGLACLAVRRHLDRDRLHQCDPVPLPVPR